MNKLLLALALVVLSGCGAADRVGAAWTGWSKSCIEGVEYIQFASGASVKYNQDGSVSTCKK